MTQFRVQMIELGRFMSFMFLENPMKNVNASGSTTTRTYVLHSFYIFFINL